MVPLFGIIYYKITRYIVVQPPQSDKLSLFNCFISVLRHTNNYHHAQKIKMRKILKLADANFHTKLQDARMKWLKTREAKDRAGWRAAFSPLFGELGSKNFHGKSKITLLRVISGRCSRCSVNVI